VAAIRNCGDPVLILVDDADQRPDLAALLASLKADRGGSTAVRVILISRGSDLASRLVATLDDRSRGMLDGIHELPLRPFGGADDRARWFGEAVRAYARARQVPPPDLPAYLNGHITDPAEPILTMHAQALLAVLDSEESRPMTPRAVGKPFDRVTAALFAHEQHRWQTSARQSDFGLTDLTSAVQAQAIAVLLLASPADRAQAVAVLRYVPDLATASDERRANIVRWAAHLYPNDPPLPIKLKPDMLAEWFVVTQVTHTPALVRLQQAMTPTGEVALLVLLAHASDHIPQAVQLFADIVAADTIGLAGAGVAAAMTASTGRRMLDESLARVIGRVTWSSDALDRVEDQLTDQLPRTWAAATKARVEVARRDDNAADLACALGNLGIRLSSIGRDQEALAAAEEAVGLFRALARDNLAHQPDLARALSNLGSMLNGMGRNREALADSEEAVSLLRALGRDNPAHQPDLAMALTNLGIVLSRAGRAREALAAAEEAVSIYRALARDNLAHQPDLASVARR
jgi:tetratricopeptide (TPR) repeat protein